MMPKTNIIFKESRPGKTGVALPESDVPEIRLSDFIPAHLLRDKMANLPEVTEPEVVRHFNNLSVKNHHVDNDFYPLGSCTMKYNPKINDIIATCEGLSSLHPLQSEKSVQGALRIYWELEQMLLKITGMSKATLQPSAGSQGEFVGLLIFKKFHEANNENRQFILIPETAHGTNPASVILAGYKTKKVKSDSRGRVDIEDLKNKMDDQVAGMMLTQPNTLGLFEDQITEITDIVHAAGGLMYMDGANLNALIGISRPIDMGFDITHINLHKTFSTPHGGGGPGSGPIAVVKTLEQFLPVPTIEKTQDDEYHLNYDLPDSIGRVHSFYGNFSIIVRAWAYILTLGDEGLVSMTKNAILNANYLKSLISDKYDIPYSDGTLHEFVASGIRQKDRGIKILDVAKALLDYGYHSPTVYFPINIPEAMMVEPTESETKETIEQFAKALLEIDKQIDEDPELLRNAPISTPVRRLDETKANREPDLRWNFDEQ
ncbi:MAG: aminomethyl-transferring glycine dehydrogenase subunit GcvPB [Candidatus Marinimicrobia bacterium]|jgi:glycine dehydrogenase subunit 2|nr:aminomethyl-transferring glycine dehydrogenase subunit GcvPB [Candidatus Neomarinimicrobiota bacterium]MBT3634659.1 aminomethyl-transferring glycine dehydrogenase subunit GcvPB [Candidatus Neomarinimicrobiota bacterium]MBT3682711.1 aminomethyl-transferring glycine dehydrogenase subunit GcvPB [Candidatus Neomarinimicrobiota bacterium]MBT3759634.1 aminomethyl-transferring glycine dehydrogenase subunit GcvPB [Candidatus Neomarinimicrobiota bacterium]MBT3894494.1 aminomethyl-transferring glycine